MRKGKSLYSVLVMLMTVICVGSMLRGNAADDSAADITDYTGYAGYEDREYLGYIFDDYNKSVNIEYVDKLCEKPVDDGSRSILSWSAMNEEYSKDAVRRLRSERIIEELALKEEKAKSTGSSIINAYNSLAHGNMDLNDRVDILNLMRNLDDGEIIKLKRLFDKDVTEGETKIILEALNPKFSEEEYNRLINIINKYTKKL